MSLAPGTRLGPYEIVALIGAGGMGDVYKARDTRLDRIVAIKVSQQQHLERFRREARAIAALNHPNICTIHDAGNQGDTAYIAMEFLEGHTLKERIAGQPMGKPPPPERASAKIEMEATPMTPSVTVENPLRQLAHYGQSIWLDYIRRSLISSGELGTLIERDGLAGMTSNPSIFEKAIAGGEEYADFLKELRADASLDAKAIYERLAIRDIRDAADALRQVYLSTNGRDGYVSLEVSPQLATETQPTIEEARRLWNAVGRPNVMIKVPGTSAGLPAIETLLAEGINVNITLLFACERYEEVAQAYLRALQERARQGLPLASLASVASFFVSRIDTNVDGRIDALLPAANENKRVLLESCRSKVAIANAKIAYAGYQRIFSGPRWEELASKGARVQRLLWASTSTKNPKLRDVLYVEELIGKDTVNTIPLATLDAFRDHGEPRASLEHGLDDARAVMRHLAEAGISMQEVTAELLEQGVRLFDDAFVKLLAAVRAA
jgi:transaldolase